jgi:hypothetical protein
MDIQAIELEFRDAPVGDVRRSARRESISAALAYDPTLSFPAAMRSCYFSNAAGVPAENAQKIRSMIRPLAPRVRERQHPLPQCHGRKHVLHEVRRGLRHLAS